MKKSAIYQIPEKLFFFSLYLPLSLENANFVALLCLLFLATYQVSYHSQTGGCLVKSVGLNRKHLGTSCNLMVSSITAHYIPKHVTCYFDKTTIISYFCQHNQLINNNKYAAQISCKVKKQTNKL